MPSPMIKTGRQDIYNSLVEQAGGEGDDTQGFLFDYQYELFSLGLVLGYLEYEPDELKIKENKGQDILRIGNLSETNEHRQTVELLHQLVQMELEPPDGVEDPDRWLESTSWDYILEIADAGVEQIADSIEVQEDFDLLRIVTTADTDNWHERLGRAIGDYT
jgi:hypothetical protein